MRRFNIIPVKIKDFEYELYRAGFESGKPKVLTEDELKNNYIQDLILRKAVIIQEAKEIQEFPEAQEVKKPRKTGKRKSSIEFEKIIEPEINEENLEGMV